MTKSKSFFVISLLCSILINFTGCKNFFSGADFIEELQNVITEVNSPDVTIYIAADADTGTVTPSGNVTYKVGNTFQVNFTESKLYKFDYWEVIDKDTLVAIDNALEIVNTKGNETTFKILNNVKNIFLHPVCIERPSVSNKAPLYTDSGVSKDSSIIITFNKDLSEDNDFSGITITSGGISVKDCYKDPVLNNNILTFAANPNNLINASTGLKSITVTIPADLYYSEGNGTATIGYEESWIFLVNNSTDSKAEITFSVDSDKGTIKPEGTVKYNINESVKIAFTPNGDFDFTGWNILDSDGEDVDSSILSVTEPEWDSSDNAYTSVITCNSKISGCSITPSGYILPSVASVYPQTMDTILKCDQSIQVNFSIDIKQSTVSDFTNIIIEDKYGNDITDNFSAPIYSNKTLTLKPDGSKISGIFNNEDITTIKITISKNITDAKNNKKMLADYSFNVRYSNDRNYPGPQFNNFKIAKDSDYKKEIDSGINFDYEKNHVKSLFIKGEIKSPDCDFNGKLVIKETLIQLVNGTNVNEIADAYNYTNITKKSAEIWEIVPFEYTFSSLKDGIVKLDFEISDYAGNKTVQSYYVVKDTSIILSDDAGIFNIIPQGNNVSYEEIVESIKTIYVDGIYDDSWASGQTSTVDTLVTSGCVKLKWGTDKNNYNNEKNFIKVGDKYSCYIDNLSETETNYLCLEVSDLAGNKYICERLLLPKTQILGSKNYSSYNYVDMYYSADARDFDSKTWCEYYTSPELDGNNYEHYTGDAYNRNDNSIVYSSSDKYCVIVSCLHYNESNMKLYSFPSDVYDFTRVINQVQNAEIDWDISIKEGNNDESIITVSIPAEERANYDKIMVQPDFMYPSTYNVVANKTYMTLNTSEIRLSSGNEISVKLTAAKDNTIYFATKTININSIKNTGPKIYTGVKYNKNGKELTFIKPEDSSGDGLELNGEGETKVTIYYTNWRNDWPFAITSNNSYAFGLDNEKIKKLPHFDVFITPPSASSYSKDTKDKETFTVKMPELNDGNYLICMSAKDALGYEAFEKICKYNIAKLPVSEIAYTSSSTNIKLEIVGDEENKNEYGDSNFYKFTQYYTLEALNIFTKEWDIIKDGTTISGAVGESVNKQVNLNFTNGNINDITESTGTRKIYDYSYARLTISEKYYEAEDKWWDTPGIRYGIRITDPIYFQTYNLAESNRPAVLFTKDNNDYVLQTNGTLVRALAQIVYSKTNYGNSDPNAWERMVPDEQKIHPQVLKAYDTYSGSNVNDVPVGNWYTIILHCPNGTVKMTEPVFKNN